MPDVVYDLVLEDGDPAEIGIQKDVVDRLSETQLIELVALVAKEKAGLKVLSIKRRYD